MSHRLLSNRFSTSTFFFSFPHPLLLLFNPHFLHPTGPEGAGRRGRPDLRGGHQARRVAHLRGKQSGLDEASKAREGREDSSKQSKRAAARPLEGELRGKNKLTLFFSVLSLSRLLNSPSGHQGDRQGRPEGRPPRQHGREAQGPHGGGQEERAYQGRALHSRLKKRKKERGRVFFFFFSPTSFSSRSFSNSQIIFLHLITPFWVCRKGEFFAAF